jgi:hypothetical protein
MSQHKSAFAHTFEHGTPAFKCQHWLKRADKMLGLDNRNCAQPCKDAECCFTFRSHTATCNGRQHVQRPCVDLICFHYLIDPVTHALEVASNSCLALLHCLTMCNCSVLTCLGTCQCQVCLFMVHCVRMSAESHNTGCRTQSSDA